MSSIKLERSKPRLLEYDLDKHAVKLAEADVAQGPAATVDVVRQLVNANDGKNANDREAFASVGNSQAEESEKTGVIDEPESRERDQAKAEVAAEVADTAQQLD